jgi:hypothetical protein
MKLTVERATEWHAHDLAPWLRPSDRQEIRAYSGRKPLEALLLSLDASDDDMCWAVLDNNGYTIAMFGANRLNDHWGGIWLLGSHEIATNKRDAWVLMKTYLDIMHERYAVLTNFIDARNEITLRWLPKLGFKPLQAVPDFGVEQRLFIQFASFR